MLDYGTRGMREGSFSLIITNMQAYVHATNTQPSHTPVHQRKSHSIKLLYPEESDSINEAYL